MLKAKTFFVGHILYIALFCLIGCSDANDTNSIKKKQNVPNEIKKVTPVDSEKNHEKARISEHQVFLTNFFEGSKSIKQTSFGCEDKIYTIIEFKDHSPKLHQIQIEWKDPHGEVREQNNFPYYVSGDVTHAWSSLSLHRSVGAGMLQWINPAAGMEEFIGNWTVSVKVSDIINETVTFEVLC